MDGMTFNLEANKTYMYKWQISYFSHALTSGIGLAMSGGPLTMVDNRIRIQTGANATSATNWSLFYTTSGTAGTGGSVFQNARVGQINSWYPAYMDGVVKVGPNPCVLTMLFRSNGTGGTASRISVQNGGGYAIDLG